MNLLNKLTIKNLKLNKKRTIVTIMGIILAVALITAVASMYASGIASLINFEKREKGDYHVAFYDVDEEGLKTIKETRGIESFYVTKNIGYAKLAGIKNEDKPYVYVKAFSKDALNKLAINLVKGRLPENGNEILIPTHLETNGRVKLNIGDTITLNVGKRISNDGISLEQHNPYQRDNEQIINTQTITYTVVGIIERPSSAVEEYSAPGYTFITYINDDLKGIVDVYTTINKISLKNYEEVTAAILGIDKGIYKKYLNDPSMTQNEIKEVQQELSKAKYKWNINSYLISLETNPLGNNAASGLGSVVVIVCLIIVVTSAFCIKNSFDISITEKIKQYGMLRSVGATKKQIKRNVFYEATILGLIGIPLGILMGILASVILVWVCNYFLNTSLMGDLRLIFDFSLVAIVVAIILGIVTIYLSAFRSARKAAKITPMEAIRNSGNIKLETKKIKQSRLIYKLFGIGGEISYKNLKRNKKKYRTTVISIVVSTAVFIALSYFMSLAFLAVEDEINLKDYNVSLYVRESNYEQALETVNLDNIKDYTIRRSFTFNIINPAYSKGYKKFMGEGTLNSTEHITVLSVGKHQYQKYIASLGLKYEEIKDKGILINDNVENYLQEDSNKIIKKYLPKFEYKKNDTLKGKIYVANAEEKEADLQIGYITREYPMGIKDDGERTLIIISDEVYEQKFKDNLEYKNTIFYYDSSKASKLQDDIEEILKDTEYSLDNLDENVETMNNLFILVGIFLYGFIIVITLIGVTNIFNTITTSMSLRKQEFAMLKSIGMTKREFNKMIRLESIFMGVKTLVIGIPIGVGLSYLIYLGLGKNGGLRYEIPFMPIILAMLAVFLLIIVIMKFSMNKINKQNIIETIRNDNI